MNTNKNTNKKLTENAQIIANYQAWLQSGEPAINKVTNELLHQDPAKPFLRCYEESDLIRMQLPMYWFIREDKTLITFKYRKKILTTPQVVNVDTEKGRPCYAISIKKDDKWTTKPITDYDLMTLVWNPQAIYGNARKLLEESLYTNLGARATARNKAQGHHYDGLESDGIVMADFPAHDFCHRAPNTDEPMTEEQTRKFSHDLGAIAEQEPNRFTVFYKGDGASQGLLNAKDKLTITADGLFNTLYEFKDYSNNTTQIVNLAMIAPMIGLTITPHEE